VYRNYHPTLLLAKAPDLISAGKAPAEPFADLGEDRNSAVKYPVTVGANVSDPSRICTRDIAHVISCVKRGIVEGIDIRAQILTIREIQNQTLANAMKKQLPWFCGSLCEGRRSNKAVKLAHFIVYDLDHVRDIEAVKSEAIARLPFIRYAFRSVRDGVKLIAWLDKPVTNEKDFRLIWEYLALQIETVLRLKVDRTNDWSRACFFSYDPDLIVSPQCLLVSVESVLRDAGFLLEMVRAGKMRASQVFGSQEQRGEGTLESSPPTLESSPPTLESSPPKDKLAPINPSLSGGGHGLQQDRSTKTDKGPGVHASRNQNLAAEQENQQTGPLDSRVTHAGTLDSRADTFEKARMIVQKLAKLKIEYIDWISIGMALYAGFGEMGRELWDLFQDNPNYADDQRLMDTKWRSFRQVREIGLETLFFLGGKYGCQV